MYICRALQSSHLQPFLFKGQTFHLGRIMAELLNSLKEVQAYLTSQQKVLKTAGSLAACMDQAGHGAGSQDQDREDHCI